MSKKKSGCSKKDKKHKDKSDRCRSKQDKRAKKDSARAYFLGGETGVWAKKLAAADHGADSGQAVSLPVEAGSNPTGRDAGGLDLTASPTADIVADPVLHALANRRSISKVGPETPSDSELRELIRAVSSVADHKSLKPWRFIVIRGDDRLRLGAALDEAAGQRRKSGEVNGKPLRAELLLALVSSPKSNSKVPDWEQHATAAGAGHLLELALWQAGWGVMWRTGTLTNEPAVRRLHGLKKHDLLMGWFYIGSVPERYRRRLATSTRPLPKPDQFLTTL